MKAYVALILFVATFLRFFRLDSLMPFFSDIGWFYISARDMILTHHVPLVGITSSHTWLHQGALWTYVLAIILKLFNFNPLVPGYFSALVGVITVAVVYKVAKVMFSERIALISAIFYATSPLIVIDSRMPYHTTFIPLLTILLIYVVFRWVKGSIAVFPLIALLIGLLYNSELATFPLVICVIFILLFGLFRKKEFAVRLINLKTIILTVFAFLLPMIPMILYDIHHGFPQTIKFIGWFFYKIAVIVGFPAIHPEKGGETWLTFIKYGLDTIRQTTFLGNSWIALLILVIPFLFLCYVLFNSWRKKKMEPSLVLIFLFFFIPAAAYVGAKTNSSSYFLMFFPQVAIIVGWFFGTFFKGKFSFLGIILILLTGWMNLLLLLNSNYNYDGLNYRQKLLVSKQIIKDANGKKFNVLGKGWGSQFESFTTPYKYLIWWQGSNLSNKNEKHKFYIVEYPDKIKLIEQK